MLTINFPKGISTKKLAILPSCHRKITSVCVGSGHCISHQTKWYEENDRVLQQVWGANQQNDVVWDQFEAFVQNHPTK